ncbi:uncharacterized protein LOC121418061 [Lytechinus variegatus]|uniref:uncharacterized protein LOC121418061 n=1 Tax=Lytechinus variegatus TaxID=7654 RepID=UPI001BB27AAA|nr:uncharacterized protein LOC121418061 [Lytechinus variegatus]
MAQASVSAPEIIEDHGPDLDDDDFMTVSYSRPKKRPGKRPRLASNLGADKNTDKSSSYESDPSISSPYQNRNLDLIITPIEKHKSFKDVSPAILANAIKAVAINPVERILPIQQGKAILVKCKNIKQLRAILQLSNIGNLHVKVEKKTTGLKGVISNVPLEMTEKEIVDELKLQGVTSAKRISKTVKNDNPDNGNNARVTIPLCSVLLTFNRASLPDKITMYFQFFMVKQYIPWVTRCFKCQRYGHGISQCRSKVRCVRCGENHTFEECKRKEDRTCVNCGGKHSAAYNGCIAAKKAKKIQQLKIQNNITYAQATKFFVENGQANENNVNKPIPVIDNHPSIPPTNTTTPMTKTKTPQSEIRNPDQNHPSDPPPSIQTQNNQPSQLPGPSREIPREEHNDESRRTENNFANANNEQIIELISHLIFLFTDRYSKKDVINIVEATAQRLLNIKANTNNEGQ